MLIDKTHRWWIIGCAAGIVFFGVLYLGIIQWAPGQQKGGSLTGLYYGLFGSALMAFCFLLIVLRRVPKWWWIGARQSWLRGHLWLGTLSGLLIWCHTGFRWGGWLEWLLSWTVIIVLVTGFIGMFLQHTVPRLMTTRVVYEAPYEQIPYLCQRMRREADNIVDDLCGEYDPEAPAIENTMAAIRLQESGPAQLRSFYEKDIRPFLVPKPKRNSPLLKPLQTEARFAKLRRLAGLEEAEKEKSLDQLAALCEERRQLYEQERIHRWLHAWLLVHVPAAVAVVVLGTVHAVTALSGGTFPWRWW